MKYDIPLCHECHEGNEYKNTKCSTGPTCVIFLKCRGFKNIKYDIPVCHEFHEGHEGQEGHEG